MDKVENVEIKPLEESIYMKPLTMHFVQNGNKRTWDLLSVHDAVFIVIYNISKNTLVFVKQFRPAVYFGSIPEKDRKGKIDVKKYPPKLGVTLEFCAGIADKNVSMAQIAQEEVLEETGYNVNINSLELISAFRSGVGTTGALFTAYYCEVTDDMKVSEGGGVNDEIIDVIEMTIPDVKKYILQEHIQSPPSFLFGLYWFLYTKAK